MWCHTFSLSKIIRRYLKSTASVDFTENIVKDNLKSPYEATPKLLFVVQQSLLFVDLNALEISSKLITSKKLTTFTKFHKYRAG